MILKAKKTIVENHIFYLTNGPNESRMLGDITSLLYSKPSTIPTLKPNKFADNALNEFCMRSNGLALCAYVQGFYNLAFDISTQQIRFLTSLDNQYARICEIQARINLLRLNRACVNSSQLQIETDLLLKSLERCKQIDRSMVPVAEAKALDDGTILNMVDSVAIVENAKLAWMLGDFQKCHQITSELAINSPTAMEILVRCLLEMNRIAEVIELAYKNIGRHHWLKAYAIIALLRGFAFAEARKILEVSDDINFLPMIRVAIELTRHGLNDECGQLMKKLIAFQLSNGQEASALVAASFCQGQGLEISDDLLVKIDQLHLQSRHFPSIILHTYIVEGNKSFFSDLCSNGMIHPASLHFLPVGDDDIELKNVTKPATYDSLKMRIHNAYLLNETAAADLLSEVHGLGL